MTDAGFYTRDTDQRPLTLKELSDRALGLQSVAENLLKQVRRQRAAIIGLIMVTGLCLLLTVGWMGNARYTCRMANLESDRQHGVWDPVVKAAVPSQQRDEFQQRFDRAYEHRDCNLLIGFREVF